MLPLILAGFMIIVLSSIRLSPLSVGVDFPVTAPLVMFTRIALRQPPWWQIALSTGILSGHYLWDGHAAAAGFIVSAS